MFIIGWIIYTNPIKSLLGFTLVIAGLGGIISITNSQLTMIYEKYLSAYRVYKSEVHTHSIRITHADQSAMIIGSVLDVLIYQVSELALISCAILCYFINLYFFLWATLKKITLSKKNKRKF